MEGKITCHDCPLLRVEVSNADNVDPLTCLGRRTTRAISKNWSVHSGCIDFHQSDVF